MCLVFLGVVLKRILDEVWSTHPDVSMVHVATAYLFVDDGSCMTESVFVVIRPHSPLFAGILHSGKPPRTQGHHLLLFVFLPNSDD